MGTAELLSEEPFGPSDEIEVPALALAVIHHRGVRLSDLRKIFDGGFSALGSQFATGVLVPAGPALAIYHGDPMATFDMQIGFPVVASPAQSIATGQGTHIVASALPGGPALATSVLGDYDELGAGWTRLREAAAARGRVPTGDLIEIYVSDPSTTTGALRTDLVLPLH